MPEQLKHSEMDLQGIEAALRRAAQQARRIAAETNTAVVYVIDGKIVEEYPTLEQVEQEEAAASQTSHPHAPTPNPQIPTPPHE